MTRNDPIQPLKFDTSASVIAQASQYVPGGVNSAFRTGMQPGPLVFDRGEGAFLFQRGDGAFLIDVDGNRLIDYYCGMGAMVLGHSPVGVQRAVQEQVTKGILFAGQSRLEFEAARMLTKSIPSAQKVRFGSSGSEIAQAALRLARAATGRRRILKFEGHYHGWFDNILWSTAPDPTMAGPVNTPLRVAGSKGQAPDAGDDLVILPWNDLDLLKQRLAVGDIAAVLMEPAMCNQGAIAPLPGYLEGAKEACDENGAVLIFDEVITGFRLGRAGAQGRFNVTPDLSLFAKAIANGFPVAALAGRDDLMDMFATAGVLHGGTFNSQPVAMAAMIATQEALTEQHFSASGAEGLRLRNGVAEALARAGIMAQVTGFELMFHIAFGLDTPARNYRDLARADRAGYARFAHALLRRGMRVLERGAWFVSSEHRETIIDDTIAAVAEAAAEVSTA